MQTSSALVPALVVSGLVLLAASAAAAPSLTLVWTQTTGAGVTGTSTIEADVGDELWLSVIANIDAEGFTGAAWDLTGSAGLTAAANSLVPGSGGPPECPAPPNLAPGTCFSAGFKTFMPQSVGVVDAGSSTTGYDVGGLTAEFAPSILTVGVGVFVVGAGASVLETVATSFPPGEGGVLDGNFQFSVPPVATATIEVGNAQVGQPQTKDQQKCSDALLAGSLKVTKEIQKQHQACIKSFQRGKALNKSVPAIDTLEECILDDPKDKIGKASLKLEGAGTKRCTGNDEQGEPRLPPFGPVDATIASDASKQKEFDLVHDVLAADLDAGAVVTQAADKAGAACQLAVVKAVAKCQQTKQTAFRACSKDALSGKLSSDPIATPQDLEATCLGTGADAQPDDKGKIAKKCADPSRGIQKVMDRKCQGQDLDALFGCELSCASDDTACVSICLEAAVECRFCRWANAVSDLGRDCDAFDDGVVNASCPAP